MDERLREIHNVIEKYSKTVVGIAMTHTKNKSDADDVFQEVFLTYQRKNMSFNDEEHRKAWIIRTTINCSKKIVFGNWRKKIVPLGEIREEGFEFLLKEENAIYNSIVKLPMKYRNVIHLFYFEDMTIKEISSVLKIKENTIKVQLNRGRNILREILKGDYFCE